MTELPPGYDPYGTGDGSYPEPAVASDEEADAALASGVLSDDDPAADPFWPGIAEHGDEPRPDAFPDSWGANGPTERDQAAIDAGNAPTATDEELLG